MIVNTPDPVTVRTETFGQSTMPTLARIIILVGQDQVLLEFAGVVQHTILTGTRAAAIQSLITAGAIETELQNEKAAAITEAA